MKDALQGITYSAGTGSYADSFATANEGDTIVAATALSGGNNASTEFVVTDGDKTLTALVDNTKIKNEAVIDLTDGTDATLKASVTVGAAGATTVTTGYAATKVGTTSGSTPATGGTTVLKLSGQPKVGSALSVGGKTFEFIKALGDAVKTTGAIGVVVGDDKDATSANLLTALQGATLTNVTVAAGDNAGEIKLTNTDATDLAASPTVTQTGGGLTLQVGDTNDAFNKVTVSVDDLSAAGIGTAGLNVSNQDAAGASVKIIKDAINKVSTNRANLGSLQNRLEYTINNLDTTAENMTAANSRIRDTDMAKEMMNYTKMNILTQAAQAMLAQANQQPQAILQLLQ